MDLHNRIWADSLNEAKKVFQSAWVLNLNQSTNASYTHEPQTVWFIE